ncbi:MAG: UvrD-helicase domain-containing protein [Phycisphaeraceae bacterium]
MTLSTTEQDPLLEDLTAPQRQAVTHVQGPLLVLAGAGSGKTRVITRRIAHMVLRIGIAPWNVLAITFTNKAAGEMKERVAHLMSEKQARATTVCTFHSLCTRILRQYGEKLGLARGYSIYDTADQERAVKDAITRLELNTNNFPPSKMLAAISTAKNELIDEDAFAKDARDFISRHTAAVYRKYQEILKQNNALDFDDLLIKTVQLMRQHADVLAALRQRYQYILIDEYQDTNHAQFVIAHALASGNPDQQNICATGDPDQSIYSWRGANIRNILEFEQHYPSATVVRLEQNYRSTKAILAAADKLIQNNKQRRHKSLWTDNEAGEPVRVVKLYDERHEAQWIVGQMQEFHNEKDVSWGDMAVFYRMNSLSRVMEDALRNAGVPYQIARGTAFYQRAEIKDAVAFLRAIANPADEVNLLRIINRPARGISETTVKLIQAQAVAQGTTANEVLRRGELLGQLNARAANSVKAFARMLDDWRVAAGLGSVAVAAEPVPPAGLARGSLRNFVDQVLRESGLHDFYANDKSDPDQERLANLGELVSSAQQFEEDYDALEDYQPVVPTLAAKLDAYLEQISLVADVDSINSAQGAVTLMTLHAAKGLEFPVVAIIGLEDGLLPHERARMNASQAEEERRLCFVGITRARRFLMLTHARYRTIFGQTMPTIPSRFLAELSNEQVQDEDQSKDEQYISGMESNDLDRQRRAMAIVDGLAAGMHVRHAVFGEGRVLAIQGWGAQARAQVHFNRAGIKTLIIEYAHLEPA